MRLKICLQIVYSLEQKWGSQSWASEFIYEIKREPKEGEKTRKHEVHDWEVYIIVPKTISYPIFEAITKTIKKFDPLEVEIDWEKRKLRLRSYAGYHDEEIREKLGKSIDQLELTEESEEEI